MNKIKAEAFRARPAQSSWLVKPKRELSLLQTAKQKLNAGLIQELNQSKPQQIKIQFHSL